MRADGSNSNPPEVNRIKYVKGKQLTQREYFFLKFENKSFLKSHFRFFYKFLKILLPPTTLKLMADIDQLPVKNGSFSLEKKIRENEKKLGRKITTSTAAENKKKYERVI